MHRLLFSIFYSTVFKLARLLACLPACTVQRKETLQTLLFIVLIIPIFPGTACSQFFKQSVTISSSPNPVGSGARAMGMGGAFIAVADDATAASWNPAGLTQLRKPECSFVMDTFRRREKYSSKEHPEAGGVQKIFDKDVNYFSIAYPFEFMQRNIIVSLNYQKMYEFERSIKASITDKESYTRSFKNTLRSYNLEARRSIDFQQSGRLSTLSPAIGVQVTPDLALGITCNIWTDKLFWRNGWTTNTVHNGSVSKDGVMTSAYTGRDYERYYDFQGFNMHLGFLWQVNRNITIGGVVKTPFTGEMKHERRLHMSQNDFAGKMIYPTNLNIKEDVDLHMPLSYGLGVAVRFTDRFTMSFDIYRTEWDQFYLEDGSGNRISPITGNRTHETDVDETHQIRLGAEYLIILPKTIIPIRCGLFYDPEPSGKSPEDYWGFTLGTGISFGPVIVDIAYQFRRGEDVEGDVIGVPHTKADVTQHQFMASMIYHF